MIKELEFLFSGIILGLAAGISPGPLLALAISETLRYGKKEGLKVSIAPLVTDLPIILFALVILSNLDQYNSIIGVISLFGAGYLIYLGIGNLRAKADSSEVNLVKKGALKRGVIANISNPHPYLFWLSIGGTIIFKSLAIHVLATVFFIAGFYILLIGSKIAVVLIVEKSKSFIRNRYYLFAVRILGMALILLALAFFKEGLKLIGCFSA